MQVHRFRFPVELRPEWTVADLKNVLYKLTNLAPDEQKLLGIGHAQVPVLTSVTFVGQHTTAVFEIKRGT